jgi:cell division topological specificity factor
MRLFAFLTRARSAPVARERLQVLLAHERAALGSSDLISVLREEILAVIARHVSVSPEQVRIRAERGGTISTLEVEVEVPAPAQLAGAA